MHSNPDSFQGLGIAPKILEFLWRNEFHKPTPIQYQCIPVAIERKDIVGIAQTGTGKTMAFGIPMLQSLAQEEGDGLVLVPTRELAVQVDEVLQTIGNSIGIKTAVLIGGEPIERQRKLLKAQPQVLIATPGRLIDLLLQRAVGLKSVRILILDEADRMLDMGFLPQIRTILQHLPEQRQTMLFSATMPPEIVRVAARYMKLPVRVEVAPSGTAAADVTHEVFFVEQDERLGLLERIIQEYQGSILVFTRTKIAARRVSRQIRYAGHRAIDLHSDRSLEERQEALEGFKVGKYRILIATDIAARGIDVVGIEVVINYDLPANGEDYVHRIGRTGRAGAVGHAISFAMPHQRGDVKGIEQVVQTAVKISTVPGSNNKRRDRGSSQHRNSRRRTSPGQPRRR